LGSYEFAWAGKGTSCPELISLGYVDFSSPEGRKLVSNYDFMITVGNADANPTTILEALSWGLIPVCTPTSGYQDEMGIVNIPHDDVNKACAIIEDLQAMDSGKLSRISRSGNRILSEKYNWRNFFEIVTNSISTDYSPKIDLRKFDHYSYPPAYGHKMLAKLVVNNFLDLLGRR
jgi:glycosyltransferase involved in cell wall biosynthesis